MSTFRFNFWRTDRSTDAYYYTNWDRKVPVAVDAETEKQALELLGAIEPDVGRNRYHVYRLRSVEPTPIAVQP